MSNSDGPKRSLFAKSTEKVYWETKLVMYLADGLLIVLRMLQILTIL